MFGRHKPLILVPAILLIPILLGMTPLNMAHRLASGGTTGHCKPALNNHCLFNSIVSHNEPTIVNLRSTPLAPESTAIFNIQVLDLDSIHSDFFSNSVPLRC